MKVSVGNKVVLIGAGDVGLAYSYALINQGVCDHLAIIDAGAVVAEGSPSELIADAERRHQGPDRFRGLTDVFFQAAGRSFHQQNK